VACDGFGVGVAVMRVGPPEALIHQMASTAFAHVLDKAPWSWSTVIGRMSRGAGWAPHDRSARLVMTGRAVTRSFVRLRGSFSGFLGLVPLATAPGR
jgi:hypothetical protein